MQTNNSHFTPAWRAFFAFSIVAAILQVAFALALLLQDTSEAGSRLFLGFSPARLLIIGVLSGVLVFFVWLLIRSWTNPAWTERQFYKLCNLPQHPKTYTSLLLIFGLLALGGLYTITLTPELSEPFTAAVFNRLLPFTILVTGLSAQALLMLILARFGSNHKDLWKDNAIFWLALVIFSLFFVLWGWVSRTTLPSESAITGWNDLGVPILEMQVFLAWLAGIVTWGLTLLGRQNAQTSVHNRWLPKFSPKIFDLGIFLILWIGTILLWNSTPSVPSWFLSTPRPPNYELYPNSDALAYDMSAQSLLNGEGILFANEIYVRRPALALFFAILHSLGGQSASMVIFWQIVFLAVTPAFVYFNRQGSAQPAGWRDHWSFSRLTRGKCHRLGRQYYYFARQDFDGRPACDIRYGIVPLSGNPLATNLLQKPGAYFWWIVRPCRFDPPRACLSYSRRWPDLYTGLSQTTAPMDG